MLIIFQNRVNSYIGRLHVYITRLYSACVSKKVPNFEVLKHAQYLHNTSLTNSKTFSF